MVVYMAKCIQRERTKKGIKRNNETDDREIFILTHYASVARRSEIEGITAHSVKSM
jgi:hypothetical protein